jgi:hypothetical protein
MPRVCRRMRDRKMPRPRSPGRSVTRPPPRRPRRAWRRSRADTVMPSHGERVTRACVHVSRERQGAERTCFARATADPCKGGRPRRDAAPHPRARAHERLRCHRTGRTGRTGRPHDRLSMTSVGGPCGRVIGACGSAASAERGEWTVARARASDRLREDRSTPCFQLGSRSPRWGTRTGRRGARRSAITCRRSRRPPQPRATGSGT